MTLPTLATKIWLALWLRVRPDDPEAGDVPGWVLVTVMSAALVVAILTVARTQLTAVFQDAVSSVAGG